MSIRNSQIFKSHGSRRPLLQFVMVLKIFSCKKILQNHVVTAYSCKICTKPYQNVQATTHAAQKKTISPVVDFVQIARKRKIFCLQEFKSYDWLSSRVKL